MSNTASNGFVNALGSAVAGVLVAKVRVAGLRRAGPKLTRRSLVPPLQGIRRLHFGGGLEVTDGPDDQTGLDSADL